MEPVNIITNLKSDTTLPETRVPRLSFRERFAYFLSPSVKRDNTLPETENVLQTCTGHDSPSSEEQQLSLAKAKLAFQNIADKFNSETFPTIRQYLYRCFFPDTLFDLRKEMAPAYEPFSILENNYFFQFALGGVAILTVFFIFYLLSRVDLMKKRESKYVVFSIFLFTLILSGILAYLSYFINISDPLNLTISLVSFENLYSVTLYQAFLFLAIAYIFIDVILAAIYQKINYGHLETSPFFLSLFYTVMALAFISWEISTNPRYASFVPALLIFNIGVAMYNCLAFFLARPNRKSGKRIFRLKVESYKSSEDKENEKSDEETEYVRISEENNVSGERLSSDEMKKNFFFAGRRTAF